MQSCCWKRDVPYLRIWRPAVYSRQPHTSTRRGRRLDRRGQPVKKASDGLFYRTRRGEEGEYVPLRRIAETEHLDTAAESGAADAAAVDEDRGHDGSAPGPVRGRDRQVRRRSLPLPPILQPEAKLRDKFPARREKHILEHWSSRTLKTSADLTSFSAKLAKNPYAQALAAPVRECNFTNFRLPNSCLIDFHAVEREADESRIELLPLSLAAAQISNKSLQLKKQRDKIPPEKLDEIEAARQESTSWKPLGTASWVLGKERAINFICDQPEVRATRFAVSKRMTQERGRVRFHWRPDMQDFILENLRAIVLKKLSWFLRIKKIADRPGVVCLPPGGDITRIDDVDDIVCVARLTEPDPADEQAAEEQARLESFEIEEAQPSANMPDDGASLAADFRDPDLDENLRRLNNLELPDDAAEEPLQHLFQPTESPHESGAQAGEAVSASETSTASPAPDAMSEPLPQGSSTFKNRQGGWSSEKKTPSFLQGLRPLGSPIATRAYMPTLRYRNQRVPLYNLHALLGADKVARLVKGTVFEHSDWLVLTEHVAAAGAYVWLLKLAAYLARTKRETAMIKLRNLSILRRPQATAP